MELPDDILALIKEYSQPITRPDWRKGGHLNNPALVSDIIGLALRFDLFTYEYTNYRPDAIHEEHEGIYCAEVDDCLANYRHYYKKDFSLTDYPYTVFEVSREALSIIHLYNWQLEEIERVIPGRFDSFRW